MPTIFKSRIMPVLRLLGRGLAAAFACPPLPTRRPSENEIRFHYQKCRACPEAARAAAEMKVESGFMFILAALGAGPGTPHPDYFGSRCKSHVISSLGEVRPIR